MKVHVSDHALIRFLERAGGLDAEGLRETISASLTRSMEAASRIGASEMTIVADGLLYVVRHNTVITVLPDNVGARQRAARVDR